VAESARQFQTAARSSYVGETNVVAKAIDIAFVFHPFLETTT
jgi:hypothetical protein